MPRINIHDLETFLLSESDGDRSILARHYLVSKLLAGDKSSNFARKNRILPILVKIGIIKDDRAIIMLQKAGYDAMLLSRDKDIIGYTAFQETDNPEWRVFSVDTGTEYLDNHLLEKLVKKAASEGIKRIRIGEGNKPYINRLISRLIIHGEELGIEKRGPFGWVYLK